MLEALALPFFRTALLASLVLAGIHAYLGFHVVRSGVIFVDLALAQMAALGVAVGVVLQIHENPIAAYLLALGMTLVGAASFAWLRRQERQVPLEAFIGIVFATAQALVFLVLEKSPAGPEHLKETFVGTLFTIAPDKVLKTAILYAVIGTMHCRLEASLLRDHERSAQLRMPGAAACSPGTSFSTRPSDSWSPRLCRSPGSCSFSGSS